MPAPLKSKWDQAVEVLAENHFRQGRNEVERKEMANRYMTDLLHHLTNHMGKDEKSARKELEDGFGNAATIRRTMAKYPGLGL